MDRVDFRTLRRRLSQNGVQEKLTKLWVDRCLSVSNGVARRGAHGVCVDNVRKNGMPDPQISARSFRVAKQEDLAILEFATSRRICDGGIKVHALRNDRVIQIGLPYFLKRERNTERGRTPSEGL